MSHLPKHQLVHKNYLTMYLTPIITAKKQWPIVKHQIVTLSTIIDKTPNSNKKHQVDMDKTSQHHHNKQEQSNKKQSKSALALLL